MRVHESAENYLEAILVLQNKKGSVHAIDIATELEFSKPSVSIAMKNLREKGYIETDAAGCISLTSDGRKVAEKIYERHTMLIDWLTAIGVSPEVAEADACRIEHVISEESFEALKKHADQIKK